MQLIYLATTIALEYFSNHITSISIYCNIGWTFWAWINWIKIFQPFIFLAYWYIECTTTTIFVYITLFHQDTIQTGRVALNNKNKKRRKVMCGKGGRETWKKGANHISSDIFWTISFQRHIFRNASHYDAESYNLHDIYIYIILLSAKVVKLYIYNLLWEVLHEFVGFTRIYIALFISVRVCAWLIDL